MSTHFLDVVGNPMYKAANVLSGFKRLFPKYRKALEMSSLYFQNWSKTVPRKRALPLKPDWVKIFATYAYTQGHLRMGLMFVVGCLGLFRIEELLHLKLAQLSLLSNKLLYVVIPDSKGAKLKGQAENISIKDVQIIAALARVAANSQGYDLVFRTGIRKSLPFYVLRLHISVYPPS